MVLAGVTSAAIRCRATSSRGRLLRAEGLSMPKYFATLSLAWLLAALPALAQDGEYGQLGAEPARDASDAWRPRP